MSNGYVSFYKGVKCVCVWGGSHGGKPFSKQVLGPSIVTLGGTSEAQGASGQRGATTVTRAPGPDIPGGL